jgi:hypothetical protein
MLDRLAILSPFLEPALLKRLHVVLLLATVLAWTWPAHAATVAIVSPPGASADVTEALTLLRGELLSVGLDVAVERRPMVPDRRAHDSRQWLEELAAGGASAVVDAVAVDAALAVDVWIVRSQPLRFEVTRVSVGTDTPKASEVLSLRAVEALRAGLLLMDRATRRPQPSVVATALPETVRVEQPARVAIDVGASVMTSFDGVGLSVLPLLRLGWAAGPSAVAQATLAGAGSRPIMKAANGAARISQQYATLGGGYRFRARERLWPFLTLAAGAVHTSVQGQTDAATHGHTEDQWSLLLEAGLGIGLRVSSRYYLTLVANVQLAEPYVIVHIGDDVATTGRPNVGVTLTMGAWL